jgi:hypothetical protein
LPDRTIRELNQSELGREIAVDLEADTDFNEGRGGPSHELLLDVNAPTTGGVLKPED